MTDLRTETTMSTPDAPPPPDDVLSFRGVSRHFGDVAAVDDVSFTVGRGQIVGLLGHNGAGKTTIVRLLAGLLAPGDGEVRVLGHDPVTEGVWVRRRLGVLPSSRLVDLRLTARENLDFAARLFDLDPSEAAERGQHLLDEFGIAGRADDPVSEFSSGMRQRVALARVLLSEPEVLLLDEPSSAMDPVGAQEFRDLVRAQVATEGRTVVLCTHDLVEADDLCDEVIILSRGRTLVSGEPRALAARLGGSGEVSFDTHPDDAPAVHRVLSAHGHDVDVDRGTFEVTRATREAAARLVADLTAAGVRIYAVEPRRPTLTDLYFALHETPPTDPIEEAAP